MIEGQPHSLLRGSLYTGAEGLLYMPHSAAETDKPAVEKIGLALARMAHALRLEPPAQGLPPPDRAGQGGVARLPTLGQRPPPAGHQAALAHVGCDAPRQPRRPARPDGQHRALPALGVLSVSLNSSEPSLQPLNYSLNGLVAEVRLKLKTSYLLDTIRPCVEEARRECSDGSDKNIRLAASEALNVLMGDYWQKRRENWPKRARRLRSSSPTCTRAGSTPSSRRGLTISRDGEEGSGGQGRLLVGLALDGAQQFPLQLLSVEVLAQNLTPARCGRSSGTSRTE